MTPRDYQKLNIVDGPNRDRLVDCWKYAYDKEANVRAEFTLDNGDRCSIMIEGVFHESGSGHSNGFYGQMVRFHTGRIRSSVVPADKRFVRGLINTNSPRHGFIEFSSERLTFSLG